VSAGCRRADAHVMHICGSREQGCLVMHVGRIKAGVARACRAGSRLTGARRDAHLRLARVGVSRDARRPHQGGDRSALDGRLGLNDPRM